MAEPQIPQGYRQLDPEEVIQEGDYVWVRERWARVDHNRNAPVGNLTVARDESKRPAAPEGTRLLELGEVVKGGDLYYASNKRWLPVGSSIGRVVEVAGEYARDIARDTAQANYADWGDF